MRHFITHLPGWNLEGEIESLEPGFFGASHWRKFWPKDPQFLGETGPQNAFALRAKLSSSTKSVQFIFLGTEASQTYRILANCNLLPTAIVLHNGWHLGAGPHGFGDGSALHHQARTAGLPQLLLVGANTPHGAATSRLRNSAARRDWCVTMAALYSAGVLQQPA